MSLPPARWVRAARRRLGWPAVPPGADGRSLHRVRAGATRVALISTAIVAGVYLVISVMVALIVTQQLTAGVDGQLNRTLSSASTALENPQAALRPGTRVPGPDRESSEAQLMWLVATDGTTYPYYPADRTPTAPATLSLPLADGGVTQAQTLSLNGASYRLAGMPVAGQPLINYTAYDAATGQLITDAQFNLARIVVGQPMSSVTSAQSTVILAEGIILPVLLILVFFGALTVGRRVAAPIELARLRQMEFTADASHELRTPLSVIEAQTALALAEKRNPAWYRAAFERVQGESGRMRRLVEDLLWLARFDATANRVQAEHVDVAILAGQAVDRFTAVAEAKHVRLSVWTAPEPLVVHAPPEWLDRLLGVLLDNACKYAPEGGAIDVEVRGEGNRVRLSVDDSGPGISPAERRLIFDRFYRATEKPGGAGLGLAIADSVVRATGGRWQIVDSAAGGASMAVTWPRSLTGSAEPEVPQVAPEPPPPALA
ncbi:MAG: HAMP domain-containing sensor histidine kinase [Candidatus Dormibacteria bacterium]